MDSLAPGAKLLGYWRSDEAQQNAAQAWYRCEFLKYRDDKLKAGAQSSTCLLNMAGNTGEMGRRNKVCLRPALRPVKEGSLLPEVLSTEEALTFEWDTFWVRPAKRKKQQEQDVKKAKLEGGVPRPLSEDRSPRLPPHRYVMAPMVGGSELPFRMMARRFGTQLCYTPMIYSGPFANDEAYRADPANGFQTCQQDRPLVAHFCGNDPEVILAAAKHIVHSVDAVDLNLGCPQRVAHAEHFGSYLLDPEDRQLVCSIVKRLSEGLPVPVFCKIRLLDSLEETLQLVRQLEASGASLIAVHARYRGSPTHRRDGPAHLDQVAIIKKVVKVPVLANGNVKSWGDVVANLRSTGADGVMSAEGMLDDPCLFADALKGEGSEDSPKELRKVEKKLRQVKHLMDKQASGTILSLQERQKVEARKALRQERKKLQERIASGEAVPAIALPKDGLVKARQYLATVSKYPPAPSLSTLIFHCRRMAKAELTAFQMLEDFKAASSLEEVKKMLSKAEGFRDRPESFQVSKEQEQRDREARAQQAYELECRRKYEERMARKAARLGMSVKEIMKPSSVPGGSMEFNSEPSWLLEKGDERPDSEGKGAKGKGKGRGRGWRDDSATKKAASCAPHVSICLPYGFAPEPCPD
ncbi:unnamed protein product [Effrenium voratum]|uniref:tRNA-dihydrouridine(16/17) synthase [NAD(P)(+)] n=1 Tax=Effrenium voratum TaxID=2562239 RepID=A0AA36NGY9_9DINO|nr:unnamed protein product [Effrenium voratum]